MAGILGLRVSRRLAPLAELLLLPLLVDVAVVEALRALDGPCVAVNDDAVRVEAHRLAHQGRRAGLVALAILLRAPPVYLNRPPVGRAAWDLEVEVVRLLEGRDLGLGYPAAYQVR